MTDTTEPLVPLLRVLTDDEKADGIAEAIKRAAADTSSLLKEFPRLGHQGFGFTAKWSQKDHSLSVGVLVEYKALDGGVIATKFDDDLQVLAVARVRLGGSTTH